MLTPKIEKEKKYRLGIIAPHNFSDSICLHNLIANNLAKISHIITNNVASGGLTVQQYAEGACIPFTVYPIIRKVGGTLISNAAIIRDSDFIYIFDNSESTNVAQVVSTCKSQNKKYKVIFFTPSPN